jgi:hypothetical protein
MEDGGGNRFRPSFTIRRGRRYRYYVSQHDVENSADQRTGPIRLPAHEVESRVRERLQEFLKSDAEIFDGLTGSRESPAVVQQRVSAAKKLAARLPLLPSDDLRDLLTSFLQKVIVRENEIQVLIRRPDLHDLLEKGERIVAAKILSKPKPIHASELICLTIEAKRKRYGGEVHLVVPPNSNVSVRHPRASLIKAVVRGHAWYEKILDGKDVDPASLARVAKLSPEYVRNVLGCAFHAPDIVEAVLDGRQPPSLKFANLYKHVPLIWAEQRRQFGFPQRP